MSETKKQRKLAKLGTDFRVSRAKLEVQRRTVETQTGDVPPRTNDDPGVWLLADAPLAELASNRSAAR